MFKQCLGKGLVAGLLHGKVKGLDFFFQYFCMPSLVISLQQFYFSHLWFYSAN